jgi:hypothetical protein
MQSAICKMSAALRDYGAALGHARRSGNIPKLGALKKFIDVFAF